VNAWVDLVLVLVVLTNLGLLGSSRLQGCIRLLTLQAVLLGLLPLLAEGIGTGMRVPLLALGGVLVKAVILPWLLRRAVRAAGVQHEVEPLVGFTTSLIVGVLLLGLALHFTSRLPLPTDTQARFVVPAALFTIMAGLFLVVSRVKAIMQVVGYLTMENGIYVFGLAFAVQEPLLVETGVLLDVFVAVFVMGIIVYRISREFDHIDTDRLSALKD
jgi:hydrogenase-4 component E